MLSASVLPSLVSFSRLHGALHLVFADRLLPPSAFIVLTATRIVYQFCCFGLRHAPHKIFGNDRYDFNLENNLVGCKIISSQNWKPVKVIFQGHTGLVFCVFHLGLHILQQQCLYKTLDLRSDVDVLKYWLQEGFGFSIYSELKKNLLCLDSLSETNWRDLDSLTDAANTAF